MEQIRSYFRTLDKESATILISSAILMVIYVYQGHHNFFIKNLAPLIGKSDYIDWYQHLYQFLSAFVLFLIIPAIIIKIFFKKGLKDFGVQIGDAKFGLKFLILGMIILLPMLYINSFQADFQAEYPLTKLAGKSPGHFVLWELCYLIYYISWEFFFRGYMQMGLKEKMGAFFSIMTQTLPSTIIHIGKPEGETMAAIAGGIVFGAVALRTRSILWVILIHWYLGGMTDLFCLINAR